MISYHGAGPLVSPSFILTLLHVSVLLLLFHTNQCFVERLHITDFLCFLYLFKANGRFGCEVLISSEKAFVWSFIFKSFFRWIEVNFQIAMIKLSSRRFAVVLFFQCLVLLIDLVRHSTPSSAQLLLYSRFLYIIDTLMLKIKRKLFDFSLNFV